MKKLILVGLLLVLFASVAGCANTDDRVEMQVEQQQQQYVNAQPVPQFDWSLERHVMIELYKARNNAVSTYSITYSDFRGVITWGCPSIGYPIPGGTQLTNPEKVEYASVTLPQPEPNGLYTPGTSAGTYVMCVNLDGTVSPVYVEDYVRAYPYPVTTDTDGRIIPAEGSVPSISINPNPVP